MRVEAAERAAGSCVCRTSTLQRLGASMCLERRGAGGARARRPAAEWNQGPDGRTPAPRPGALAAWCTAPPSGTPGSSHAARSQARRSPDKGREFQGSSPPRPGPGRAGAGRLLPSAASRYRRSRRGAGSHGPPACAGRAGERSVGGASGGGGLGVTVAAVTGAHTRSRDDGVQAGGEGKRTSVAPFSRLPSPPPVPLPAVPPRAPRAHLFVQVPGLLNPVSRPSRRRKGLREVWERKDISCRRLREP